MSSTLETDGVHVRGELVLGEFTLTAADIDAQGVFTIDKAKHGVTLIVDAGVTLRGIKVMDSDNTTDVTTERGGMTIFLATDSEPYPATFTVAHDDAEVAAEHRFDCPTASGGARTDVTIGRLQTSIRYSSALSRWVLPNWSA